MAPIHLFGLCTTLEPWTTLGWAVHGLKLKKTCSPQVMPSVHVKGKRCLMHVRGAYAYRLWKFRDHLWRSFAWAIVERNTSKATYKSVSKPSTMLNPKRDSRERQHAPHALPEREGWTSVHFKSKPPSLVCWPVKCVAALRSPPCFTESGPQRSANCVGTPRCILLTLWLTVVRGGRACMVSLLLCFL